MSTAVLTVLVLLYIHPLYHLVKQHITTQYSTIMSWFSSNKESSGPGKQNFHPVTSSLTGYGPLAPKDTAVSPAHLSLIIHNAGLVT